jgi:hypothetical protein
MGEGLGYLSLPEERGGRERTDVDGLLGDEENRHQRERFGVRRLTNTALPRDPHHDWASVREQIETPSPNGRLMGGFVRSYSTVRKVEDPGEVMGYYTHTELPVFDFLARHFCVCDRWFCSFPGATIPNRLFSLAGTSRRVDNSILTPFVLPSVFEVLGEQGVPWEVFFEDIVPALSLFSGHGAKDDPHLHGLDFLVERRKDLPLPPVSWIDPFFLSHRDDDHPPADLTKGQLLVQKVFDGLRARTEWPRTLLIVTYDEHGGFFDHVPPPGFGDSDPIPDDSPDPGLPGGSHVDRTDTGRAVLAGSRGGIEGAAGESPRLVEADPVRPVRGTRREGHPGAGFGADALGAEALGAGALGAEAKDAAARDGVRAASEANDPRLRCPRGVARGGPPQST